MTNLKPAQLHPDVLTLDPKYFGVKLIKMIDPTVSYSKLFKINLRVPGHYEGLKAKQAEGWKCVEVQEWSAVCRQYPTMKCQLHRPIFASILSLIGLQD